MDSSKMESKNFNDWVLKAGLNKWQKVDKKNFVPPPTNINLVLFTASGTVYCGHYKRGFICYGIGARELTDVEVTHWKIELFPDDYQEMLDKQDLEWFGNSKTKVNTQTT